MRSCCSAHAYYFPAQAGRGSESSNTSHFHIGAPVHVGENNKVRSFRTVVWQDTDFWTSSFMAHPEILLTLPEIEDPVERFVAVTKFYLCGWHIKPPYVYRCLYKWRPVKLTHGQRRKEAAQPYTRRDIHWLVGLPRWNKGLLHLRTNLASSSEIELLFYSTRTQHEDRWNTETSKQILGQLGCKFDGRHCSTAVLES
jgi:hypothetical protein